MLRPGSRYAILKRQCRAIDPSIPIWPNLITSETNLADIRNVIESSGLRSIATASQKTPPLSHLPRVSAALQFLHQQPPKRHAGIPLRLKSLEQRGRDALWIRYEVVRSETAERKNNAKRKLGPRFR